MTAYLHKDDTKNLERAAKLKHQSVLISGQEGLDHLGAAKFFASKLKAAVIEIRPIDRVTQKVDIDKGKILVSQIRDLYDTTKSKSTRSQVVIIHSADTMTLAAQGAFLKLLEEPRKGLHFILLSKQPNVLLGTILSRVVKISLRMIPTSQSKAIVDQLGIKDSTKRLQIMFIADGLPIEIERLASDQVYFDKQSGTMSSAKQLLQAGVYEKLVVTGSYKEDREAALALIDKALLISRRSLKSAPSGELIRKVNALLKAKEGLESNGNVRLMLMESALS